MKKFIAAAIFLMAMIFVKDSQSQVSQEISLDEAIRIALVNNSDLINARFDKRQAEEKVSEVYSDNLVPNITLNSRYTRAFKKQVFDFGGQKIVVGSDNSFTSTIDVSEPIPILGTPVFTGIRIAEYYTQIQDERIRSLSAEVKTNVKKAYLNVLLAKEVIAVNQQSLDNSLDNLNVVEIRYRNGASTEFDFLRAKIKVENLKPVLSQSINNLEVSKKLLLGAMGLSVEKEIDVTGSLYYDTLETFSDNDAFIEAIAENNVNVKQLRINKRINEELVKIDESNYLPKLSLFGQYSLLSSENDDRALSDYRFFNTLNAGISLSWNLNLFKNSFKVNQSEIEVKKSEESIINLKRNLKIRASNIIARMQDARNRIIAQMGTIAVAERGYELAEISFRNGVITQIDVLDSQLSLSQAQLAYLQTVYEFRVAKAELEELLEQ